MGEHMLFKLLNPFFGVHRLAEDSEVQTYFVEKGMERIRFYLLLPALFAVLSIPLTTAAVYASSEELIKLLGHHATIFAVAAVSFTAYAVWRVTQLELAQPLSVEPDKCEQALELVEKHALCAQYRDSVLSQGRAFRGFDLEKLRKIAYKIELESRAEVRERAKARYGYDEKDALSIRQQRLQIYRGIVIALALTLVCLAILSDVIPNQFSTEQKSIFGAAVGVLFFGLFIWAAHLSDQIRYLDPVCKSHEDVQRLEELISTKAVVGQEVEKMRSRGQVLRRCHLTDFEKMGRPSAEACRRLHGVT